MATVAIDRETRGRGDAVKYRVGDKDLFRTPPAVKRARAKRIRKPLGPFETSAEAFDRGMRQIEIVRVTAQGITYRLKGQGREYTLPHAVAFAKAVSIEANFDAGPREGKRITRGTV